MMTTMTFIGLTLVLWLQISHVTGYGSGPPASTCFTQYPKHYASKQTTPSPFVVTFNPTAYTPGQDVTITVEQADGAQFLGIQMAARRTTGNTEEIVGRFLDYDTNKTKTINCFGGYQNQLTHANNNPVTQLTFKWRPPIFNVGNVNFRATFLRSFSDFWHDVGTELQVVSNAILQESTYPNIPLAPQTSSINFDDCGDTKGCYYYPRSCSGSDCKVAATYRHRSATKDYLVELHLNEADSQWVSLGFSKDEWMGDDFTMTCTSGVGWESVQEGRNPGQYNERLFNLFSSEHEIQSVDGKLQCRFVIPETVNIYRIDDSVTDSFKYSNTEWDLTKDYYLMLAWGPVMSDSNTITFHPTIPPVTSEKVDVQEKVITFASAFHKNVQIHATLMILAWVLFAGIVTVISRHYRVWFAKKTLCGSALWFQVHRFCAIIVTALTLAGIIVIFAHYGTGVRDLAKPHAWVGFASIGCLGLQLIGGILRPHLEHSLRPVFNIGHRFTGHAGHILAAATMFLAYEIDYIDKDMRELGIITLSVWVGVQVFWHVIFEIIKRYRSRNDASNTYKIDQNGLTPETPEGQKETDDCPHTTTLITYVIILMGVCAGVIFPIYQY